MLLFELVIGLLFAGALFALFADRVGVPYPALLALVGAGIALVPGIPDVALDPELALVLFVAPTLLDSAYDASPRDLRRSWRPLMSLAVAAVLLTVGAVACVARLVVPEMGWAAAIALGAIVAPPDASAATAVLRKLHPPHRLLVVLEGESLFNDATSLLIYRVAVGALVSGTFSGWHVVPMLLLTCGGGVLVGWLLARLWLKAVLGMQDIAISVVLQFVGTFAVWMIAERLHLSAIITVVVFAMTLSRNVPGHVTARSRIASYAVWDVVVLVLNVLAFVLIGLQLRGIVSRVQPGHWHVYAWTAAAVCATVIVVRIAWILVYSKVGGWLLRVMRSARADQVPGTGYSIVASWCGMRGIVTLATALALPAASTAFPHRDLLIFCAYCVVLVTLVVQGATLRPLMRWMDLRDDDSVEREVQLARVETARAALRHLEAEQPMSAAAQLLRSEYHARLVVSEPGPATDRVREEAETLASTQQRAVQVQRETLTGLRARDVIGDDAFHVLEEELDLLELTADQRVRPTAAPAAPPPAEQP
jgi:Na+/H+ antiporter